jgi:hypothetical protein
LKTECDPPTDLTPELRNILSRSAASADHRYRKTLAAPAFFCSESINPMESEMLPIDQVFRTVQPPALRPLRVAYQIPIKLNQRRRRQIAAFRPQTVSQLSRRHSAACSKNSRPSFTTLPIIAASQPFGCIPLRQVTRDAIC